MKSDVLPKFDVAILGVWYGLNYGSLLTYYALQKQIKATGKSVVMVKYLPKNQPKSILEEQDPDRHNNRFIQSCGYQIQSISPDNVRSVNELADTFIIGSDQVWNYHIAKLYDEFFYMSHIDADKRKIANAVSFGHSVDFADEAERPRISNLMKRFNAISVREDSGTDILRDKYGVRGDWQADPLLTMDRDDLLALGSASTIGTDGPGYLLAYILDPSPEKIKGIVNLGEKLGSDIRVIADGFDQQGDMSRFGDLSEKIQKNVGVEEFVALFANASYVVTDSFHGTVMSIKLQKEFAVPTSANMHRGFTRLDSLLRLTGLLGRHTFDPNVIATKQRFLSPIDYDKVNKILDRTIQSSLTWLRTSLDIPVDMKVGLSPIMLSDAELTRILRHKPRWEFGLAGHDPYSTQMQFNEDGTITGVESKNERFWEVSRGRLLIKNDRHQLSHLFVMTSLDFGKPVLQGDTAFDHSLVHVIR